MIWQSATRNLNSSSLISVSNKKIPAILLLTFYLVLRVAFENLWRSISWYYSYLFEIIFVLIAYFNYRGEFTFKKVLDQKDALSAFLAFISGVLIFKASGLMGISIPFDFTSFETVFFLLIVAPVLEELIFRMALWESLRRLVENKWAIISGSTLLFSLGHLMAFWFVPDEFKNFVLYQSVYVILLSQALGWLRFKTNSITTPMLVHFAFNFGFFLGTKF